mmetsp:Transcript_91900/g.233693  ORF Transcript_91900/g.233693 Transcript_91900/m.233693 type:complete len:276 (+) Transcript_91900:33-860(+)
MHCLGSCEALDSDDVEGAEHIEEKEDRDGGGENEREERHIRAGQRELILVQHVRRRDDDLVLVRDELADRRRGHARGGGAGAGLGGLLLLLLNIDEAFLLDLPAGDGGGRRFLVDFATNVGLVNFRNRLQRGPQALRLPRGARALRLVAARLVLVTGAGLHRGHGGRGLRCRGSGLLGTDRRRRDARDQPEGGHHRSKRGPRHARGHLRLLRGGLEGAHVDTVAPQGRIAGSRRALRADEGNTCEEPHGATSSQSNMAGRLRSGHGRRGLADNRV